MRADKVKTAATSLIWRGIQLYTVRAGGHVIPQQAYDFPRLLGKTASLLDAPRKAFRFFEGDRLV